MQNLVTSTSESAVPPVVFISYSRVTEQHIAWVTELSRRLRANGIDVRLDKWDVRAGQNLNLFMEQYRDLSSRVIVVLSDDYGPKADDRGKQFSGVGTETTIVSPTVYRDLGGSRVIPVVPNSDTVRADPVVPAYLTDHKWIDFRSDYEVAYEELLQELHGVPTEPTPPLGPNPFVGTTPEQARVSIHNDPARWQYGQSNGQVSINLNENSGKFTLGSGRASFELNLEYPFATRNQPGAVKTVRHYNDKVGKISLVRSAIQHPDHLHDLSLLPMSNRIENTEPGDVLVMLNQAGYWALLMLDELTFQSGPNGYEPVAHMRFAIATNRTSELTLKNLPPLTK